MEEEPSDPYEQQLYAVFKSCITEGQNKLDENGLLMLCDKLELEQNHRTAILELLEIDTANSSISFYKFRDSFLALLGKTQEGPEKEINGDSQASSKNNTLCMRYSQQSGERTESETMNYQQLQSSV